MPDTVATDLRRFAATARQALACHWPEYAIEAAGLGAFMVSACLFVALFEHPDSPLRMALPDGLSRRALIGVAMGLTAIALIRSPWGRRSGAHLNPAVTLVFFRLGRIAAPDAMFYALAQCIGAVTGVLLASLVLGAEVIAHPAVGYAVTRPGTAGPTAAWLAEAGISFGLMLAVLLVSNAPALDRFTPFVAGALVTLYIAVEAPLSGMSMNPARTLGSALWAHDWTALWIYFTAPPLGMVLAAELYVRRFGLHRVLCAKLDHAPGPRCIFRCRYPHSGG